jgi:photosystem II stability/assembly factor-like uncharacterized protein
VKIYAVRWLRAVSLTSALAALFAVAAVAATGGGSAPPSTTTGATALDPSLAAPILLPGATPIIDESSENEELLARDNEGLSNRLAGDQPLDGMTAGHLRAIAAKAAHSRPHGNAPSGPTTFTGPWVSSGPDPIGQVTRSDGSIAAMSGRIGALAIRPSNHQFILGAAQGGIWLYNAATSTWEPKTDNLPSLAIGALAIAPSNDAIIYAGTGEGSLAGDSYFGNGILKSTDGGQTWAQVSGDYFEGVSVSRIVVDPNNASHLYAAVLRGRGGARRVSPTLHSRFGIWTSTNGGVSWTLLKEVAEANGATDLELDPQNPSILYASFWGDKIYKSTNAGLTWTPIMNGLPTDADYAASQTRFSISLSHPFGQAAVLYVGFDWIDTAGNDHPAQLFKSTDEGANWVSLPSGTGSNSVLDYCATQCFYDNVVEADPTNPNVVFAGGVFGYSIGSGGIFRSDSGGQSWRNLGWNQHPDFHALAFDPTNTQHVLLGSDGGVWYSANQGGRQLPSTLDANTWVNLNGHGLRIGQYTSIATNPSLPSRAWGGLQDNGTTAQYGTTWFDLASGDGGQVQVDPTDAHYVYGTYFGISPYRFTDGGTAFFTNQRLNHGLDLTDRSDFYTPLQLNKENPDQLFIGTYRLYRTDNAKALAAGDVLWKPISPDLTSGCTGTAPNGARGCVISAIGTGGGTAVYTGSLDGHVYVSPDAQVSDTPTWTRSTDKSLPNRPVAQIAVDRSNYRVAYLAYNGFNAATPKAPGHVFKTTNGGQSWSDISGDLPDTPVNSIVQDASFPNTLYAGTDVGAFVTYNGGANWYQLGSGMPVVAVWQLDLDPSHGTLLAGTHGRGVWAETNTVSAPALVLSTKDAGVPVGPSSGLRYTLTVRNIGTAAASNVTVTDAIPDSTSFASADSGGTPAVNKKTVTWTGLSIPAGGSVSVKLTVNIDDALKKKVSVIVNDGSSATAAEGESVLGSPTVTKIANSFDVSLSPAAQTAGGKAGGAGVYTVTVRNDGYSPDSFGLAGSGGTFALSFFDSSCTTAITATPPLVGGATYDVCVKAAVPAGTAEGTTSTSNVTATSVGDASKSASAAITTIAVTNDTLVVDGDGDAPNVQSYYTAAITAAGSSASVWDLKTSPNLPLGYMKAFKNIVWFTGNAYPGPVLPYETNLKAYLDAGGHLFMSGQDILDQAAGTTDFVQNYLHIDWDGSEAQNDKATAAVHAVTGNPITGGITNVTIDHSVLNATFEDQITPNGTAQGAFTDDTTASDALTYAGAYKVVFLAFPFEAYGSATDKAALMTNVLSFFGS